MIDLIAIRKIIEPAVRVAVKVDITQAMYDSLVILAIKEMKDNLTPPVSPFPPSGPAFGPG